MGGFATKKYSHNEEEEGNPKKNKRKGVTHLK